MTLGEPLSVFQMLGVGNLKIFIFFLVLVQILTNNFEMLRTEVKQAPRSMSTREPCVGQQQASHEKSSSLEA